MSTTVNEAQWRIFKRDERAKQLREFRSSKEYGPDMESRHRTARKLNKMWRKHDPVPAKPTIEGLFKEAKQSMRDADEAQTYVWQGGINHLPCGSDDAWCERNIDGRREHAQDCWLGYLWLLAN